MNPSVKRVRENSCGWLVNQMARRMDDAMELDLREQGFELKYFASLMCLLEEDGLTQTELGQRVGNPQYATSRVIDVLEQRQLVERQKHPSSRRAHRITLTEKGRALEELLPAIVRQVNDKNMARLDLDERKELVRLLHKALDI